MLAFLTRWRCRKRQVAHRSSACPGAAACFAVPFVAGTSNGPNSPRANFSTRIRQSVSGPICRRMKAVKRRPAKGTVRRNCQRISHVCPATSKRILPIHCVNASHFAANSGQPVAAPVRLAVSRTHPSSKRRLGLRKTTIMETEGSCEIRSAACGVAIFRATTGSRIHSSAAGAKLGAIHEDGAKGATGTEATISCRIVGGAAAIIGCSAVNFLCPRAESSRAWYSWSDDQSRPKKTATAASRNNRTFIRGNPWFVEVSIRPTQSVVLGPAIRMSLVSESPLGLFRRRSQSCEGVGIQAGNLRF